MKVNVFLSLMGVAIAALIGFLAYQVSEGDANDIVCGVGSTLCFLVTLIPAIGLQYKSERLGVNIRMMSTLFFVLFLVCHFCFALFGVKMPYYVISNGILVIIYLAILYKMSNNQSI